MALPVLRLFVPAIANLEAALSLARGNDIAVPQAQFDLSKVSAGPINLLSNQSRALPALGLFTARDMPAPMDAKSRSRWIEIGLQHN